MCFKKFFLSFLIFSISLIYICGEDLKVLDLKSVVNFAISNNSLIKETIEKEKSAKYEKKSAQADFYPKLYFSYSYTRLAESPEAYFLNQAFPFGPKNDFDWNIGFNQPIFLGYALRIKKKMAEVGIDISKIERDMATLDVALMVKVAYFKVLMTKREVEIERESVRRLKSHVKDAKNFYKEGLIPKNDLLKSQVALSYALENLEKAKRDLTLSKSNLNRILMWDIDKKIEVKDIKDVKKITFNLDNLYREADGKSPELRLLKKYIDMGDLKIRLAKSSYYPKIFLFGKYEQVGDNFGATNNDYQNYNNFYFGVSLKWNFFEWGKKKAEVAKSKYERNSLVEKLKGIRDMVLLDVKKGFEDLKVSERNIITAKGALKQAEENFRIANLRYREGLTNSTEVLDAEEYLVKAKANYFSSLYGYEIAKAKLLRAVGKM